MMADLRIDDRVLVGGGDPDGLGIFAPQAQVLLLAGRDAVGAPTRGAADDPVAMSTPARVWDARGGFIVRPVIDRVSRFL